MKNQNSRVYEKCPSVTQILEAECGPAALSMLLGHYKKFIPLGILTTKCAVTRDGTSASKLIAVAKEFSFDLKAKGYRSERLKDPQHMPCMALWNYSHWIIIEGYCDYGFYINDPATGRRSESYETFDKSYSHMCLLGAPSENFIPDGNRFKEDLNMFKTWKPVLKDLILITCFASIIAFPNLVISFVTGIFAQNVLQDGWQSWYRPSVTLLFLMAILITAIKFYQSYLQRRVRIKLLKVSIENFFNSILEKDVDFYDQRQPGEVASRLTGLTNAILLTTGEFVSGTSSLICLIIYLLAILFINPIVFIAVLISISIYIGYIYFVGPGLIDKSKRSTVSGGYAYSSTLSAIDAVDTVKSMSLQVGALDAFLTNFNKQSSIKQELTLLSQSVDAFADIISSLMKLILIGLGSYLVINGEMKLGGLVTISMLLQVIDPALKNTVTYIKDLGIAYGDIARFADIYHDRSKYNPDTSQFSEYNFSKITYEQYPKNISTNKDKNLNFILIPKNSCFYYESPKKFNIFFDSMIKLDPGSAWLMQGDHGSGKTTFAKLLLGELQLSEGNILFKDFATDEETDSNNILCSYLNESTNFYPGPIFDSITYFGQLHNLEHFTDVANQLGITSYIDEIPGKLSYKLDATGSNISARLLKMLEVVRTLSLSPQLVIFDYALDGLEKVFIDNVLNYLIKIKSIVIVISKDVLIYDQCSILPITSRKDPQP